MKLSEILKSFLLVALIIGITLIADAICKGIKDMQNGVQTGPIIEHYDSLEEGMDFASHPRAGASTKDDYEWSMEYVRKKGIELNETEQYVIDGLYSGKLSYKQKTPSNRMDGAKEGIEGEHFYYIYGDGDIYILSFFGSQLVTNFNHPELNKLSPNISPMALIVIQAGIYGTEIFRLDIIRVATNRVQLFFMAPIDGFAFGLYSYL